MATSCYAGLGLGGGLPVAETLATCPAPSASVAAFWPLGQDHTQLRVVSVLVDVVNTDMSLQIVRSRVAMLLVRAERTKTYGLGPIRFGSSLADDDMRGNAKWP